MGGETDICCGRKSRRPPTITKELRILVSDLVVEPFSLVNREPVELKHPYDVTDLQCFENTKTSITLTWKPSKTPQVVYDVYDQSGLLGTTSDTTYVADDLTPDTPYTFTVKSRDVDGHESEGRSITVSTLNIYAYSTVKISPNVATTIQFPLMRYHLIEADVSVSPYKDTWNQFLLLAPQSDSGAKWEFDGRRISQYPTPGTTAFGQMFVNRTMVPWLTYDAVPEDTKVTLGFAVKDFGHIESTTLFFGNGVNITPAKLYEVRFYEINGFREYELTARYVFADDQQTSAVPDFLGRHPDAAIDNGVYVLGD